MAKSRGGLGRGLASLIPTGPPTDTISQVVIGGHDPATGEPDTAAQLSQDAAGDDDTDRNDSAGSVSRETSAPTTTDGPRYEQIPPSQIRPNPKNPRTVFDPDALDELAHSIREFGLLQPVVVRPIDDGYELVMGERRWRAAQQAGVDTIDAIIRRTEDADLLRDALLENIHRTNLNPLEEAAAYQQLLDEFEVTQEELARRIGRSRPVISNTIRLLALPVAVQRRVAAGVLSAGHARALLSLDDPGDQEDLAARIVAEGLSVRGTEEAVTLAHSTSGTAKRSTPKRKPLTMPGVEDLASRLSDHFETKVKVDLGKRKGKITVEFATVDDLDRIMDIMAPDVAQSRRG